MADVRKLSDEDYWQASSASKLQTRPKNLFDEDTDFTSAKQLIQLPSDDEDDTINWDNSSVLEGRSVRYRPQQSSQPASSGGRTSIASAGSIRGGFQQPTSTTSAQSGAATTAIASHLPEPSIQDVVGRHDNRATPSKAAMAKLESELNLLKRNLQISEKGRWTKIPPEETVKRMVCSELFTMELYRSLDDKLSLLDAAIASCDGNAILAAVQFLRSTVKPAIFNREIQKRPIAMSQLVAFLGQHDLNKQVELLSLLGRHEDVAMVRYRQACQLKDPQALIRALKMCLRDYFSTLATLQHESNLITEQISLIERQLPLEDADSRDEKAGFAKFREIPRAASLVRVPVLTTLYYSCLYHYELEENHLGSPRAIQKAHSLTDRQFAWIALPARATRKQWKDIEALFLTKGWFGGSKMKPVLNFDTVVALLHAKDAPAEILNKYCKLIDDVDRRIEVAYKYGCHETAIETLQQLKDRQQLLSYCSKLKPNSQPWFFAQDVLKSSNVKWKN